MEEVGSGGTLTSKGDIRVCKCNAHFLLIEPLSLGLRSGMSMSRVLQKCNILLAFGLGRRVPSPATHHHPPFKNSTPSLDTHNRHLPEHLSWHWHRHRRNHLRYTHHRHRHRHLDHGETAVAVVSRHHRRRRRRCRQHRRRNNRAHSHAGLHMYHLHLMTRVDANNHCGLLLDILGVLHWNQLLL